MTNVNDLKEAFTIFDRIAPYGEVEFIRDEVETRWVVAYEIEPTTEEIQFLDEVGWLHKPEPKTFSQYF